MAKRLFIIESLTYIILTAVAISYAINGSNPIVSYILAGLLLASLVVFHIIKVKLEIKDTQPVPRIIGVLVIIAVGVATFNGVSASITFGVLMAFIVILQLIKYVTTFRR